MEALVDRWDAADEDYCECPGPPPPPQFLLPPPPAQCRGGAGLEEGQLHFCQQQLFGAELTQTVFPSLPIIVVCSSVVLVALLVASFLLWKHKKKVQNFLPCKTEHQCDLAVGPNGVTYEDVLINHHPTRLPNHHDPHRGLTPIELLDVKYGPPSHHLEPGGKDHFNPIYEEVSEDHHVKGTRRSYDSDIEDSSEAEARTVASEDEFAEDELSLAEFPPGGGSGSSSLRGSTGGDLCVSDDGGEVDFRVAVGPPPSQACCRSLERNKDGHPSDGFLAKQNYYMSKGLNCEARLLLQRPENIYAIVEEEGGGKVPKPPPSEDEYGDIRPVYDARALCT